MIYKLTDKIQFGKHNGKTIQEIIDKDVTYIEWAIQTIENFDLDDEAEAEFETTLGSHYEGDDDWAWGSHLMDYGDR